MSKKKEDILSQIQEKMNDLLCSKDSNSEDEKKSIEEKIETEIQNYYIRSNGLLEKITLLKDQIDSPDITYDDISTEMREKIKNFAGDSENGILLNNIEYILSNSEEEVVKSVESYNRLQHNYYLIKNMIFEVNSILSTKNIEKIEKKLEKANQESEKLNKKFEGIGSTVISIILSITVTTTAITSISRINAIYIPIFIISLAWLSMTILIFINDLFSPNNSNIKQIVIYCIMTVLLLLLMFSMFKVGANPNYKVPFCESGTVQE